MTTDRDTILTLADTPQGRSETNEATGEIRTLAQPLWSVHVRGPDDLVAVACYDDAVRLSDGLNWWWLAQRPTEDDPWINAVPALWDGTQEHHAEQVAKLGTRGSDYGMPTEEQVEAKRVAAFKRLAETPPPVSGGASTCDRPGQADAAVAQAARYEWRRKVDFDGPGPWYPCDRSWIDHLAGDDLYETRSLYVTSEAALLAAKPRSEWRPSETAPSGKVGAVELRRSFRSTYGLPPERRQVGASWRP